MLQLQPTWLYHPINSVVTMTGMMKFVVAAVTTKLGVTAFMTRLVVTAVMAKIVVSAYF